MKIHFIDDHLDDISRYQAMFVKNAQINLSVSKTIHEFSKAAARLEDADVIVVGADRSDSKDVEDEMAFLAKVVDTPLVFLASRLIAERRHLSERLENTPLLLREDVNSDRLINACLNATSARKLDHVDAETTPASAFDPVLYPFMMSVDEHITSHPQILSELVKSETNSGSQNGLPSILNWRRRPSEKEGEEAKRVNLSALVNELKKSSDAFALQRGITVGWMLPAKVVESVVPEEALRKGMGLLLRAALLRTAPVCVCRVTFSGLRKGDSPMVIFVPEKSSDENDRTSLTAVAVSISLGLRVLGQSMRDIRFDVNTSGISGLKLRLPLKV